MVVQKAEEFLNILEKSKLVPPALMKDLRARTPKDANPEDLAGNLLDWGTITRWQAMELLNGRDTFLMDCYLLTEEIGRGGMGTVYRAKEQTAAGRTVAVKLMSPRMIEDPEAVARFQRETLAATSLDHPNIVRAFDAGREGDQYYLVMECIPGRDLDSWINRFGKLPIPWVCEVIKQGALGLQHAFDQGLIHRDIKPANLLVMENSNTRLPLIKITDLGLARFIKNAEGQVALTQTFHTLGSVDFVSPEQASNPKSADIRSDIFSLGCTLFYAISGEYPFPGQGAMEKLLARATMEPRQLKEACPMLPPGLNELVARMLARQVERRYKTPGEVAADLEPYSLSVLPLDQRPNLRITGLTVTQSAKQAPPVPASIPEPAASPARESSGNFGASNIFSSAPAIPSTPVPPSAPAPPPVPEPNSIRTSMAAPPVPEPSPIRTSMPQVPASNDAGYNRPERQISKAYEAAKEVKMAAAGDKRRKRKERSAPRIGTRDQQPSRGRQLIGLILVAAGLIGGTIYIFSIPAQGYVVLEAPFTTSKILLDGQPLAASIKIENGIAQIPTDAGEHLLEVQQDGYETYQKKFALDAGDKQVIRVSMSPRQTTSPPVTPPDVTPIKNPPVKPPVTPPDKPPVTPDIPTPVPNPPVTPDPPIPQPSTSPDRERAIAVWVQSLQGTLVLAVAGELHEFNTSARLPGGKISILEVNLRGCQNLPADLFDQLAELPSLAYLHLGETSLTDNDLKDVARLRQLRSLNLSKTNVTDAGLNSLQGLKNLSYLSLTHTGITDEGLKHLSSLSSLIELSVFNTPVTPDGVSLLGSVLPKCEISH